MANLNELMHGSLDDVKDLLNESSTRLDPQEIEGVLMNIIGKLQEMQRKIYYLSQRLSDIGNSEGNK